MVKRKDLFCRLFLSAAMLVFGLTLPPLARAGSTLYVKPSPSGSDDCSSWADACSLQTALALPGYGDEIWVAGGTYKPTTSADRTATFRLNDVDLYGGFSGTETVRNQRNWTAHPTVLSGDIDNNDITDANGAITETANIRGSNSYHVVTTDPYTGTIVLDGFTITGGQADGDDDNGRGGGMVHSGGGSLTLVNVIFSGNTATGDGGGMVNESDGVTLTDVTFSGNSATQGGGMSDEGYFTELVNVIFSGNTATGDGGGMYNGGNYVTLTDVTFSGNTAKRGGGMVNEGYDVTLTNVTFSGNSATEGGGMVNEEYGDVWLTNVTFSGNSATGGGGIVNYSDLTLTNVTFSGNSATEGGGGMVNEEYGNVWLTNVTFSRNSATEGGGMVNEEYGDVWLTNVTFSRNSATGGGGMVNYSDLTLTDVIFSSNTATGVGGGMFNRDGDPTLVNVTFSGNRAAAGGGMFNSASPALVNVTFSGNTATYYGGGMYNDQSSPSLSNTLFSGNAAAHDGGAIYNYKSDLTLTNATVSGNAAARGGAMYNESSNPTLSNCILWGNRTDYGPQIFDDSSSPTIHYSLVQGGYPGEGNISANPQFVDAANGNLRLRSTSPARNAGSNDAVPPDTLDLDGDGDLAEQLPFDLDGKPRIVGVAADMGAYETSATLYAKPSPSDSGDCGSWADACSLQDALALGPGYEIWVAGGTHKPTTSADRTATFQLKNNVALYGGFSGTETLRNQRNPAAHPTVLSGDIDNNDITDPNGVIADAAHINGGNAYHVVTGADAVLDGFTITGGQADGGDANGCGGGMIHSGGNLTLTNVTFSGNTATQGGGMFNEEGGNVWLTNVTLSRNTATESGGGMVNFGRASLRHVTFSGNSTKGGSGGGMVNEGGESTLVNVIFSGNSATGDGGGMVMVNTGSWSDPAMLVNVTFSGNSATGDGGGMMVMVNKVGWVYDATLVNVIFSGNTATEGGGMINRDYNLTLVNATFSGNTATESGGGMVNTGYSFHTTLTNCILWGNQAPSDPQFYGADGGYFIVNHSLVQDLPDDYGGEGNLSDDPLFVDADGPDDDVGTPDDDLRLELTSPAIDAGDSSALPADTLDLDGDGNTTEQVPLDLNGYPRFVDVPDKPNTGIGVVDMGACEALELHTIHLPLVLKSMP